MRGLILALGFLTRLPLPAAAYRDDDTALTAPWFPVVGMLVGALVALAAGTGLNIDPWLGALLGLLVWMAVTGGLHLDGLADLADALGAAHRDAERLRQVLKDPHIGSFGVLALVGVILAKLILLMLWLKLGINLWILALVAAWPRLGAVLWARSLPPLFAGSGQRLGQADALAGLWLSAGLLALLTLLLSPVMLWAIPLLWLWRAFLRARLGGMNGDCLGAGIEVVECLLLSLPLV